MHPGQLTHAVLMDHLDWFSPDTPASATSLSDEITQLARVLLPGSAVFWRSAAKKPWYCVEFEKAGFELECLGVRGDGRAIDQVNMYASFWKGVRKAS